jgi:hypothetical protein
MHEVTKIVAERAKFRQEPSKSELSICHSICVRDGMVQFLGAILDCHGPVFDRTEGGVFVSSIRFQNGSQQLSD